MPQPFKYACFVSYCHGQYALVKGFIDQFKTALKAELEPFLDEEVFIDEDRLKPGFKYDEALAQAICQSACMIVVYSPRYERSEYCVREYEAMSRLEEIRRSLLGKADDGRGFIIPVILRGGDDVPARISQHRHYSDFSRFTLATPNLITNPEYVEEIRKIAQVIYGHYTAFRDAGATPCENCAAFSLPDRADVSAWRPPVFVNR
jgi:hypothetical protein